MTASPLNCDDTIVAIASPPGASIRGIVRASGPRLAECLQLAFGLDASAINVRRAKVVTAQLVFADGLALPGQLWMWPARHSYTRQHLAEFHTWGVPALLQAALSEFCRCGARLARPGEFTLRAFLAGRIDLTQAEAVLGLVAARRLETFQQALQQQAGGVVDPLRKLRSDLLDLLADVEAGLDFADEDIELIDRRQMVDLIAAAQQQVQSVLTHVAQRSSSDDALRIVFAGLPNAGKSSLVNALAQETRAIVSPIAGTTTDVVSVRVTWQGRGCELVDTAGLVTIDPSSTDQDLASVRDRLSQAMAAAQMEQADLIVWCCDASLQEDGTMEMPVPMNHGDILIAMTKADLPVRRTLPAGSVLVSSHTGEGLDSLKHKILEKLDARIHNESLASAAIARCRQGLQRARDSLAISRELATAPGHDELIAAELRSALDALGEVVGAVYTEELLDRIFSRFCIGK